MHQLKIELPNFYTKKEEETFINYLNIIKDIKIANIEKGFLILYFDSLFLSYDGFIKIKSLLARYRINTEDLNKFSDKKTGNFFDINLQENEFSENSKKVCIIIKPLSFYSREDKELFYSWLNKIAAIENYIGIFTHLNVLFRTYEISARDFKNLNGLFNRYNIKNKDQLKIFINKKTKKPFYSQ